ncbi:hypothetical protein QO010_000234 [Caulobacter ginsengisoli]|uniref:Peptidase S8 n=1 Tax=Caulobacter ginsengisoli TaxID=400775 RepID=A0ABU0IKF1_9CAUL|nr:S8 family serine peptidase [Caulobacter ginsengisoli]MDQ0462486.1 hypothetical protein [Caulobacter ginsengisoli]
MSLSGHHGIEALQRQTTGDQRICIAVIDGPVDLAHPCFDGADLSYLGEPPELSPSGQMTMHGTHVASVIFGQPGSPVEGIAPHCRGLLIPVYSEKRRRASQLNLSAAIDLAVESGAHIINISGGQLTHAGESEDLLANAIASARLKNVLVIAAAGNDRDPKTGRHECLHVPAALPSVLTVGAMDEAGQPMAMSCWGPAYKAQGVLALGKDVLGAMPGGDGVSRQTGTSLATPIVAGVAALLLSLQAGRGETPDPHGVRRAILNGAKACDPMHIEDCSPYMAGELDAVGAMNSLSREATMSEPRETTVAPQAELETLPPPMPAMVGAGAAEIRPQYEPVQAAPTALGARPLDLGVAPSAGCGCDVGKGLVFFIGLVGYDFGTEARRDSFKQQMPPVWYRNVDGNDEFRYAGDGAAMSDLEGQGFQAAPANPYDARQMVAYLRYRPDEASSLIWTLNLELTAVYAVEPVGPFAARVYETLVDMLDGQSQPDLSDGYVERVSVPAVLTGRTVRLFSGQEVSQLIVDAPRGMYAWKTTDLLARARPAIVQALKDAGPDPAGARRDSPEDILRQVLNKLYYEYRNLGVTSPDRAMNYAATNIFSLTEVLAAALAKGKSLDRIAVVKSPYGRIDSDCWDVQLKFMDPENTTRAFTVYRYTLDVSDKLPVTLGKVVSYSTTT